MKRPTALVFLTLTFVVLDAAGRASPSAHAGQSDVWEISVSAKNHTHTHGSSSAANEERLNDVEITYTLVLTERVRGSYQDGRLDLGGDSDPVGTPAASGTAREVSHNRRAVMRDLQEGWVTREGDLDPPTSGAGVHFAWDGSAHLALFEAAAHYSGTQTTRNHVINVATNVNRDDSHSEHWVQSALFGGDAKHPVTVQQTKTGFVVDWSWTETTRDPSGATKQIDQSGHADIHR